MAQIMGLTVTLDGGDALLSSARSVLDVLAALGGTAHRLAQLFPDFFDTECGSAAPQLLLERDNLFGAEPVDGAALGACELVLKPGDRYVEFVTAVSIDRDVAPYFDLHLVHGWPILSSLSGSTTIAEARGATSTPDGALA